MLRMVSKYSPGRLKILQEMDRVSYQYYFKSGPEPQWSEEQWRELRMYRMEKNAIEHNMLEKEWENMLPVQRKELDPVYQGV